MLHRSLSLTALLLLAACSRGKTPQAESKTSTVAASHRPAGNLFDQLALEERSRPAGTPRVEDVASRLAAEGIALRAPFEQSLGSVVGAAYCAWSETARVGIVVCEYPSRIAAESGRGVSMRELPSLPGREVHLNKATTLLIRRMGTDPETDQEATKVKAIFQKL